MTFPPRRNFALLLGTAAATLIVASPNPSYAEPVEIQQSNDFGSGYSFRRGSMCHVVTASHVVQPGAPVTVRDRTGAQAEARLTYKNEPYDLAVITIIDKPPTIACETTWPTDAGNPFSPSSPDNDFNVVRHYQDGREVLIKLKYAGKDKDHLHLAPADKLHIKASDSGSIVLYGERLVGIVLRVDPVTERMSALRLETIDQLIGERLRTTTEPKSNDRRYSDKTVAVVPDVVGSSLKQAKDTLFAKNFSVDIKTSRPPSASVALPETVLEQHPPAGTRADSQTQRINLFISEAPSSPDDQYRLALRYRDVEKDLSQAFHWLRKAADQGHSQSQLELGKAYAFGSGVSVDMNLAMGYWRRAAEQGIPEAQHYLGIGYLQGVTGTTDTSEGMIWLERAAAQGLEKSKNALELAYLHEGARSRDPKAEYRLANLLLAGQGVPKNTQRGLQLLMDSAQQGYAPAQFEMGRNLYEGSIVQKNLTNAFHWFLKAAENGHAEAQNNVGVAYMKGDGVPQDFVQAFAWFSVAAARGSESAISNRLKAPQFSLSKSEWERVNELARNYYEQFPPK